MRLRNIVLAALVAAPLAWSSAPISAQATVTAQTPPAASNGQGEERRQAEPPKGVMRRFRDGLINVLPAGIRRRFSPEAEPVPVPEPQPEPLPEPEPVPEPVPETCVPTPVFLNGAPYLEDCDGNLTPMFPG